MSCQQPDGTSIIQHTLANTRFTLCEIKGGWQGARSTKQNLYLLQCKQRAKLVARDQTTSQRLENILKVDQAGCFGLAYANSDLEDYGSLYTCWGGAYIHILLDQLCRAISWVWLCLSWQSKERQLIFRVRKTYMNFTLYRDNLIHNTRTFTYKLKCKSMSTLRININNELS